MQTWTQSPHPLTRALMERLRGRGSPGGRPCFRKGVAWPGFSRVSWCQAPGWAMPQTQQGGRAGPALEAQVLLFLAYLLSKSVSLFAKCSWLFPAASAAAPSASAPENIQIRVVPQLPQSSSFSSRKPCRVTPTPTLATRKGLSRAGTVLWGQTVL